MKHIVTSLLIFLSFGAIAQPWNYLGSSTGINNASQVDIEISASGQLFMAYIDTDNSSKITVRKWANQSWQLVGTAGIGATNASGLKLIMNGENPVVAAKIITLIGATNYEMLECYSYNGTTWNSLGVGTYFWTYHSKDFSISANTAGDIFATYYNREYQTFPEGLITVKLGTGTLIGGGVIDDYMNGFIDAVSSVSTTGNNVLVAYEEDMDMDYGIAFSSVTTSTHNSESYNYGTDASKIVFEKGLNSTNYSMMHMTDGTTKYLYYQATNGTGTYGTSITAASSTTLAGFDFASQDANTFVFYRTGSTAYFKQITGEMTPSPTLTTISSGTSLAPGTCTSFATETYYGVHVIAYIDAGKCYVKEYNTAADIDDYAFVQVCEGTSWNNNGYPSIYIVDNNFSQSNITMTCTSQNTAIIPQSSITINFDGVSYYYLTISNTNDVPANTTIDLKWDLFENGSLVETIYMPATVYNTPSVSFNFSSVQACENAAAIGLVNKASPAGGTWSGAGVNGNLFNPGAFNPTPSSSTYLVYTKTSQQGCVGKDSILFTVNQTPNLDISSTPADCNEANGAASVNITGGTPSYTSYWSNGSTFTSITDLEPGQYYFNTTDANGCMAVGVASVGSNGITLSDVITDVTCNGNTSGGINLTVNGSNPPFTYAWSNGATTEDLSNLAAGSYEVNITDNNDCITTASYTVLQPAAIHLSNAAVTNSACSSSTGAVTVSYTGGSQPYTYSWEDSNGNGIGTNSVTLSGLSAGYYESIVTDDEGCTHSELILIQNNNAPVMVVDTVMASDCSNNGSVNVTNISSDASSYAWSNGSGSEDLTNAGPGTYVLQTTGNNGCISLLSVDVSAAQPEFTEICLVTVDTNTNTNLVVWEKPLSSTIDHFNIYRETSQSGQYQLAGTVLYSDESLFNDPVASPSVRSWRYKISSVDGCGVESEISEQHKTVHLTISQGLGSDYNLAWDSYEGFAYPEFIIWRHTTALDWVQLASMPTNLFTYTDTPPSEDGLAYLVTIDAPGTCTAEKAQDFNTTRSNKDKAALGTGTQSLEELLDAGTAVYPVPSTGEIQIANNMNQSLSARVFDQAGRIVAEFDVQSAIQTVDLGHLDAGMYSLELSRDEVKITDRIIIQK